ncbi:MAG: queuosine precursor transporter [Gammaproteobacteria bacterium]|nr:queuosine precursor transporter [Gammaproteobacteria bacterium]
MTHSFSTPALAQSAVRTVEKSAQNKVKPPSLHWVDRNPGINDKNLTGFCVVFAFFVGGLLTNIVIATKLIAIGPLVLPASVFIWALTYPCSDIVAEVYGRRFAHKLVLGGFVAFAAAFFIIMEAVAMNPAPHWPHQAAFETVLHTTPKVMFTILLSYLVTQFFDVHIFGVIRKKTNGKYLWLRNNLSTLTSQTLANILFLTIVFLGTMPMDRWWHLFLSNLFARYCLAFVDTAIVYTAVHLLYRKYPELKPKTA